MKACVDRNACIGCGLCESICPEVFQLNDEGISEVIVDEIPESLIESAKEAESQCPTGAITIE